ncbi:MAG: 4-hydroxy-tetrahydrodipicolinate reductase [Methanospirillaceae archaeon]|nr:4-hydroxy-tetrahydrodipicolinate reductase [Methanospirillaceae archaeon]
MTEIKVLICGAMGRMGMTIGNLVSQTTDLRLVGGVDIRSGEVSGVPIVEKTQMRDLISKTKPDVVIDFTVAHAAVENVPVAAEMGCAIILGTTGLTDEQKKIISDAIIAGNVSAVISTNYSIGMNIFWDLVRKAAQQLYEYDVEVTEAHHRYKKDAPSGTARTILEILQEEIGPREEVFGREGMMERGNEIGVHVIRGGDIVGDHTVLFAGNYETISLSHRAFDRAVFARGVLKSARWVVTQKPGIYGMRDVLGL